jgi:hypothetical protein
MVYLVAQTVPITRHTQQPVTVRFDPTKVSPGATGDTYGVARIRSVLVLVCAVLFGPYDVVRRIINRAAGAQGSADLRVARVVPLANYVYFAYQALSGHDFHKLFQRARVPVLHITRIRSCSELYRGVFIGCVNI